MNELPGGELFNRFCPLLIPLFFVVLRSSAYAVRLASLSLAQGCS